jgi:hypothetical protein
MNKITATATSISMMTPITTPIIIPAFESGVIGTVFVSS